MIDISWLSKLPHSEQTAVLGGPALKPPLGVLPKFTQPPNRDSFGFGVLIAVPTVVVLFVVGQIYARVVYHKKVRNRRWLVMLFMALCRSWLSDLASSYRLRICTPEIQSSQNNTQ
jgi:hypothetical protein